MYNITKLYELPKPCQRWQDHLCQEDGFTELWTIHHVVSNPSIVLPMPCSVLCCQVSILQCLFDILKRLWRLAPSKSSWKKWQFSFKTSSNVRKIKWYLCISHQKWLIELQEMIQPPCLRWLFRALATGLRWGLLRQAFPERGTPQMLWLDIFWGSCQLRIVENICLYRQLQAKTAADLPITAVGSSDMHWNAVFLHLETQLLQLQWSKIQTSVATSSSGAEVKVKGWNSPFQPSRMYCPACLLFTHFFDLLTASIAVY